MAQVDQVNVAVALMGGKPQVLSFDEGTTLVQLCKERDISMEQNVVLLNANEAKPGTVLNNGDTVYVNVNRSHG